MIRRFQEIQPRIVCTLEGGYNLQWLGKCFISQLGQLVSHPKRFEDTIKGNDDVSSIIKTLKKELKECWEL
jgi:acetoin utilization deacetylase AcuC-like enzyme